MNAIETIVQLAPPDAEAAARAALADQGFGVLTEIDVAAVFRAKLGVERRFLEDPRCLQPGLRGTGLADRPVREPAAPVQRGRGGRRRRHQDLRRRPAHPHGRPGLQRARRRGVKPATSRHRRRDRRLAGTPGVADRGGLTPMEIPETTIADLIRRLRRLEGQIRGIRQVLTDETRLPRRRDPDLPPVRHSTKPASSSSRRPRRCPANPEQSAAEGLRALLGGAAWVRDRRGRRASRSCRRRRG